MKTINHPWINLDDIRLWLHTCDAEHGHKCRAADTWTAVAWLIDVHNQCLIPCDPNINYQYVALSYVWGQCPSSQTTMANLEAFQIPGAFSEKNQDVTIPKTIRHAIKLVGLLNIPYLWVDRFCICQDDAESIHLQLRRMGHIYENAYLTLIAANGTDANHGLHGIEGVTKERICSYYLAPYLEGLSCRASPWYARGWTFQELFFSHRKLKFQSDVVLWECDCAVWLETTGVTRRVPHVPGGYTSGSLGEPWGGLDLEPIRITPWKSNVETQKLLRTEHPMERYRKMVCEYNNRQLTYAEDRMRAFAGVTTKMEADFPSGFIWGLPVANFEAALLWQSDRYGGGMKRRVQRHPDSTQFPTWSWVGWTGGIRGSHWDYQRLDIRIVSSEDVVPAISVDDAKTVQRLIIPACVWYCTTLSGILPIVSDFLLASRPELGEARGKLQDVLHQDTIHPFLRTRTKVVVCTVKPFYSSTAEVYYIDRNVFFPRIGYLFLPGDHSRAQWWQVCELMVLSKSLTRRSYDTFGCGQLLPDHYSTEPFKREKGNFTYNQRQAYNVLWITRRDGIAYRKAFGMISVDAIDSLPGEMMDIVLG
ncbi:heterokaryon incompatibility protein-domain-containing protein [Hypoxylon cercidicola]|nr:heterokaryon incompatibility protein-domain-containing protein [Hypoxylon cercidicola]